ncbi:MAG TPA: esterase-like activity of phytase family protein, partial [Polyangia bacterium]|nr:esterase-like activity of phytase family protein [Polyangia bacterium]
MASALFVCTGWVAAGCGGHGGSGNGGADMTTTGTGGNGGADMTLPNGGDMPAPASRDMTVALDLATPADSDMTPPVVGGNDMTPANPDMTPSGPNAVACPYATTTDGQAHLLATFVLPPTSMKLMDPYLTDADLTAALTNGALTVTAPSLGSGLDYGGGCPGTFYGIGDRGINGDSSETNGVSFPLPAYTPMIATFDAEQDNSLAIDSVIDTADTAGAPATGLCNDTNDEVPYLTATSTTPLAYDQDGLDPEDVRKLPSGDFLISEEYATSLALIDGTTGAVKVRYTPAGETLPAARYPIAPILPAIYASRRTNKGFEGLAVTPDGHTAYAILQTPMGDDSTTEFAASLVNRILRIDHVDDPANAVASAEYIVLHQAVATAFPAQKTKQNKVFFNSATYLSGNKLLLLERASGNKAPETGRLYLVVVDLSAATNMLAAPVPAYESTLSPESLASGK